jgi:hypothetical protein
MNEKRPSAPRLFAPEALELKRTGAARLLDLARQPCESFSTREKNKAENAETMHRLRAWGAELAREFGLAWTALDAERDGVNGHYGICYEDGEIRIRLRHARTGRLLKQSSLVDTLCHELAHLEHLNHGPRFKRLYLEILDRARELGYYRPGPASPKLRQGNLFDTETCGTTA